MNKWTDDEKNFVLDEYKSGKSIDEIFKMNKIKRSKYAIECKIYGHIYDLLQNGTSHSKVAKEFSKTKNDIEEIEKKAFEMKNQSDVKTMYTGDGGYKYGEKTDAYSEIGKIQNINRTMNTVLSFYENIERLNKLKQSNAIDNDFYKNIMVQLNKFTINKDAIIKSFDGYQEQENYDVSDKKQSDVSEKSQKKIYDNDSGDEGTYIKKLKKRI